MSADPNRLLFVLSARGRTTWREYREAVDFLAGDVSLTWKETGGTATRSCLLQSLQGLGHCDVVYGEAGSIISISPPALCRLPKAGLPKAVLTGARCLQTCDQMRHAAKATGDEVKLSFSRHPGPLGLLPDTILVESVSEGTMAKFCDNLRISCATVPPAWTLVNWCGTLPEVEAQLDRQYPKNFNWLRYDFSAQVLDFIRTRSDSYPRLTRYRNPVTGLPRHVFFYDGYGAEVDLSWGRYLFLKSIGLNVIAYDEKRFRLCVPVKVPLPALIPRAVCLCSGQPPMYLRRAGLVSVINCADWLMFEEVPPQIAIAATSKVGQKPAMGVIHKR